jgi:hypothetical protein
VQGCGVVEFETPEQAQLAITQFNGQQVSFFAGFWYWREGGDVVRTCLASLCALGCVNVGCGLCVRMQCWLEGCPCGSVVLEELVGNVRLHACMCVCCDSC